jgi:hypothetical protein
MVTMRPLHGSALRHGPLRRFPMVHATWAEWVHFHPDTLVVDEPGEPDDGHGADVRWPGHDVVPDFNADRLTPVDDRLSPIDVVLGIEVEGAARTYPLDVLHPHGGIANDVVAGQPVVAVGVPGTYLAVAFHREVAGRTLTFAWERGAVTADDHDPRMVDQETGSLWDLFGNAVDGPLKGEHLPFAWGGLQKWFNWSNLSPGSTIWAPDPHPA